MRCRIIFKGENMPLKPHPAKQPRLPESALIWDNSDSEFVLAYRKDFRRVKEILLLDAITFNATTTTKTGKEFEVPAYTNGLICVDLDVTGAPTDILISVEFSPNNVNWYKYITGPFGDLRYEDAAGDKYECLALPILAKFIRGKAVATGTDATKTFKLTLRALLNG